MDTTSLQPTLFALSRKATLAEAITNLAKWERTADSNIGRWSLTDKHISSQGCISTRIDPWARERKLDAVVWTALGPKKPNGQNGLAKDEELINYLRALAKRGDDAAAKEYVEKAPTQVKTRLGARICRELGCTHGGIMRPAYIRVDQGDTQDKRHLSFVVSPVPFLYREGEILIPPKERTYTAQSYSELCALIEVGFEISEDMIPQARYFKPS